MADPIKELKKRLEKGPKPANVGARAKIGIFDISQDASTLANLRKGESSREHGPSDAHKVSTAHEHSMSSALEHSSANEHSMSSVLEHSMNRVHEHTNAADSSDAGFFHDPNISEKYIENILNAYPLAGPRLNIAAFLIHLCNSHPGKLIGYSVIRHYTETTLISTRRTIDFWKEKDLIRCQKKSTIGTIFQVESRLAKILPKYYKLPTFESFNPDLFTRGSVIRTPKFVTDEHSYLSPIDREKEKNPSISLKNEKIEIGDHWPNLATAGFTQAHLEKINKAFAVQGLDSTALPMFFRFIDWEIGQGQMTDGKGMPVEDPVAYFVWSMTKNHHYRKPKGYLSPEAEIARLKKEEMEEELRAHQELEEAKQKMKELEHAKLTDALCDDLAAHAIGSQSWAPIYPLLPTFCQGLIQQSPQKYKNESVKAAVRMLIKDGIISVELSDDGPITTVLSEAQGAQ